MSEANQVQGRFGIQKVYVKDLSFEAPNTPAIFAEQKWEPEVNVQLNTRVENVGPAVHEVVLTVTVTAKMGDKTAYLAEVQQAGIFQADGFEQSQMGHLLGSFCPGILFPYVREAVSDLVTRGGFPQMLLAPVNFDLIYTQHLQQQQQAVGAAH
ncbi:MAG: protein-export chaperone SecB [Gammaproteobacteria bacterium]|nr:protein-export chaperone SecB [Gammaproteobacteria bacterium]